MKRIISLLFAFTFFIIASAQIKDEFWGCKLGTTTKAQLISKLQSHGLKCKEDKDINDLYYIEDVIYAGYEWTACYPQIRNYAPNMIQKRKESASLVKRGHSASNVTIKTYKCPLPHHAT